MGLQSKMSDGWIDGVGTPKTVTTTRAPAVLKTKIYMYKVHSEMAMVF